MAEWQTQLRQVCRDQRVPLMLAALFALLLFWAAWNFITSFATTHRNITATLSTSKPAHLHNLADLHLLGVYGDNLENLPNTQLQFTLEGTVVVLEIPAQSRALITAPNQPTKVYQVGDTLPGNAIITRIAKHYVVLNDNGTLEKLVLPIKMISNED